MVESLQSKDKPSEPSSATKDGADKGASDKKEVDSKALMAQSWVQKLQRYNKGKSHKTAAENDREADIEFLKLLEEEKNIEEKRNPSFKTIPRFFFKKPTNESSLYFKVRQEARTRFL